MLAKISADKNNLVIVALAITLTALILISYFIVLSSPPLLDEIYLLLFIENRSSSVMNFLTGIIDWNGPLPGDTWGLLASTTLFALAKIPLAIVRLISIMLHVVNAGLVFLLVREALAPPDQGSSAVSTYLGIATSLLFALHPLAPEAVSWLGGLAYELGCMFWLAAFALYIKGKRERNWTTLGLSWISFLLAVLSDTSLWSSGFIMVVLELAKSFIGPPAEGKAARVPAQEEVFDDLVDKMLDAESKNMHWQPQEREPAPNKPPSVYDGNDSADDLFDTLTPALPFIVLGVVISIRALPATANEQLPADMIAGVNDWGRVLKVLFFPINKTLTTLKPDWILQFILCALYSIPLVVSLAALLRSRTFRQNAAFLLAWLIMIVVPHLHTALIDGNLLGSRFAYSALVPTCAIIALALLSPQYAFPDLGLPKNGNFRSKLIYSTVSLLLLALLAINFYLVSAQNRVYVRGAQVLEKIRQDTLKVMKEAGSRFIFVAGMPKQVAIADTISPVEIIAFDGNSGAAKAIRVPAGQLKDALKLGKYRDIIMRWSDEQGKLQPVELLTDAPPFTKLGANHIAARLDPDLKKAIRLSTSVPSVLKLETDAERWPSLDFDASGLNLNPAGDDFIYIDCRVDLNDDDNSEVNNIKLSWLGASDNRFDPELRTTQTEIGRFRFRSRFKQMQRFYLPVRSASWLTSGPILRLKFIFPPQASVEIKEIGTISSQELLPALKIVSVLNKTEAKAAKEIAIASLSYNYPQRHDLGLVTLDRKTEEVVFSYDTSMIPQATGCSVEIARADRFFENQNADFPSALAFKVINIPKTTDSFRLSGKDFKVDGVYSIRVFAADKDGKLLAKSSDEINCLIHTRPRSD